LTDVTFGSLQRVQFEIVFFDFFLDVSGKIAGSLCPFDGGLRIGLTIGTGFIFYYSITPFA
jgi:hypothetical protein